MGLRDRFVVKWTGKLTISRSGRYKFQTCSDDGSNLYVGSRKVVNNDGLHGTRCREGSYDLRKGQHDITVNFFENGGGAVCYVKYKGPDVGNSFVWLKVDQPAAPGSGLGYFIDGGGWKLVRRVKAGGKWHPAKDHCSGKEQYGRASVNSDGADTFSLKFDGLNFDEMLFATGDAALWLVTTKEAVGGTFNGQWYSNANRAILSASDNSSPHQAKWYNRRGNAEDPWISLVDHHSAIPSGTLVYGENSFRWGSHITAVKTHNGANVFVRKRCNGAFPYSNPAAPGYCYNNKCLNFQRNGGKCRETSNNPCNSWCGFDQAKVTAGGGPPNCGALCPPPVAPT